jgi:hypothetical protein
MQGSVRSFAQQPNCTEHTEVRLERRYFQIQPDPAGDNRLF